MVQCETLELHEYESEICWCRSQLELGSSNFTGVRWTASFLQLVNLADTKLCDNTQFFRSCFLRSPSSCIGIRQTSSMHKRMSRQVIRARPS